MPMLHFLLFLYWVFRIWSQRHFLVIYIIPISHSCPVKEGCNVPWRWGRWTFTISPRVWLVCDCNTPNERPVLSGPCSFHPSACLPWHYNGTSPASMKASMPLVIKERDKEMRDTVDPWTTRAGTTQVHLYVDLLKKYSKCIFSYDLNNFFFL